MRLWSLHPELLDRAALVACWREALLAQKVLAGQTRGYTRHPQLERFRECDDPSAAIGAYLAGIADEADARGYHFDRARITCPRTPEPLMTVTTGQLGLELEHLRTKMTLRAPEWQQVLDERLGGRPPRPHPVMTTVDGPVATWERAKA
ncbi:pyrimidine dimer DNA glycosylase/endonuclease V [Luteococcus sp. Sow4_B9]|uniref:pyrimidine dimer DNA glycosylase/endonuclease V n=1 Tax=Luteococcus sp. Sow4_B9 TaxID=3438792 RepID=UPI003F98AA14